MAKCFYIFTLQLLIVSSPLLAMEQSTSFHDEYKVPNNKRCMSVAFCKDKIFIAGTNGIDIYNYRTKNLTNLSEKATFQIATHPHTPHLAVSNQIELAIYNTETEEKIWSSIPLPLWTLSSLSFCPTDLTIYTYHKGLLTLYNSPNPRLLQQFNLACDTTNATKSNKIIWHPTEKQFLYPSSKQRISIVDADGFYPINKTIVFKKNNCISSAQYSSDGTTIAIKDNSKKCCLYNLKNNSFYHLILAKYMATMFHPTKNIITLLTNNGEIEYWNYITNKMIAKTDDYYNNMSTKKLYSPTKRLDFSDDGKHLAVGLAYTCLILPVPINNLIMAYYLLLNALPNDVAKMIFCMFPRALEMQYFDFSELLKI